MAMEMEMMAADDRDLLVYLCLRESAAHTDGVSAVSVRGISSRTGYTPLTVIRAVRSLEEAGYIKVVGQTARKRNMYTFPSTLEATDYSFFDTCGTKARKAAAARKVLTCSGGKADGGATAPSETMDGTIRRMCEEIEDLRRFKCSVLGQKYVKKEY